jgi:hypothetical protein
VSIPLDPPNSPDAEASVVGQMLAARRVVGEVIGTLLEPRHFYLPALRALFHEIVAAYYADDPIDPLVIGELASKTLARLASARSGGGAEGAAARREAAHRRGNARRRPRPDRQARRRLPRAARPRPLDRGARRDGEENPDEVAGAGLADRHADRDVDAAHARDPLVRRPRRRIRPAAAPRLMAARAQGIELGAYFGLSPFLDNFLRGLQPTEL